VTGIGDDAADRSEAFLRSDPSVGFGRARVPGRLVVGEQLELRLFGGLGQAPASLRVQGQRLLDHHVQTGGQGRHAVGFVLGDGAVEQGGLRIGLGQQAVQVSAEQRYVHPVLLEHAPAQRIVGLVDPDYAQGPVVPRPAQEPVHVTVGQPENDDGDRFGIHGLGLAAGLGSGG
jgi:hypothetical protein